MSLNNVNLSPYLIAQMFEDKLVSSVSGSVPANPINTPASSSTREHEAWKCLGGNEKRVIIVVNYTNAVHIPDNQLDFLTQLLKACKLSLNDVTIINKKNYTQHSYTDILEHFHSKIVLLFGLTVQEFGFPFEIPFYQVQSFARYTVLHSPSLDALHNDKSAKGKLWASLKIIFGL